MNDLLAHIVRPLLQNPEVMEIEILDGEEEGDADSSEDAENGSRGGSALLRVNLYIPEAEMAFVCGEERATERAIRHMLSIASGSKKPFVSILSLESRALENSEES
jgi:hypothetical protein